MEKKTSLNINQAQSSDKKRGYKLKTRCRMLVQRLSITRTRSRVKDTCFSRVEVMLGETQTGGFGGLCCRTTAENRNQPVVFYGSVCRIYTRHSVNKKHGGKKRPSPALHDQRNHIYTEEVLTRLLTRFSRVRDEIKSQPGSR